METNIPRFVYDHVMAKLLNKPLPAIQCVLIRHPEWGVRRCAYRLWRMEGADFLKYQEQLSAEADAYVDGNGKVTMRSYKLVRDAQGRLGDDDGSRKHTSRSRAHPIAHGRP